MRGRGDVKQFRKNEEAGQVENRRLWSEGDFRVEHFRRV